uniref:XPG N-terminal domain-containing protein n=1 Tax=Amphimedon queenslandica TaxID=400682 RepID=A0A1X7UU45_AMPQE
MGVKDLWKILEPSGRAINPETLKGQILAVDVSIWLNQAIKGARDHHGNEIPKPHLLVLFNRICKLLFYQIRPVFVFDGPPPPLKTKTLELRRRKRKEAGKAAGELMDKRSRKLLEAQAIKTITGKELDIPSYIKKTNIEEDMFYLPEKDSALVNQSIEEISEHEDTNYFDDHSYRDDDNIDVNSESFSCLPPEIQHDLLLEKKEKERTARCDPMALPKDANDFSNYQLSRVMRRSQLSRKLGDVRKTLNRSQSNSLGIPQGTNVQVEANRILSTEERRYILIQGTDSFISSSTMEEATDSQHITDTPDIQERSDDFTTGNASPLDTLVAASEMGFHSPVAADEMNAPTASNVVKNVVSPTAGKMDSPTTDDVRNSPTAGKVGSPIVATPPVTEADPPEHYDAKEDDTVHLSRDASQTDISDSNVLQHLPVEKLANNQTILINESSSESEIEFEEVKIDEPLTINKETTEEKRTNYDERIEEKEEEKREEEERGKEGSAINEEEMVAAVEDAKELMELPTKEMEVRITEELESINKETNKQERRTAGLTTSIIEEAKELLRLFGLPYLESPSEAEAQCSTLESLSLTQGTITDDNDVFLFGGMNVYRHMFTGSHDVEYYRNADIETLLGLDRNNLIILAYLLGCDYTDGIEGVGVVNALELVQFFKGEGLEPLIKLKQCNIDCNTVNNLKESPLQKKIRGLSFPDDFPNVLIRDQYMRPAVDDSKETFEWGTADLDLIRE